MNLDPPEEVSSLRELVGVEAGPDVPPARGAVP